MRNETSVIRALKLLEAFTSESEEITLSALSRASGVPKTTVHRMVGDLLEWGALERGRRGLRLGLKLFELGQLVPTQRRLRNLSRPYLENLHERTGNTVNLAVSNGSDVVYLEKLLGGGRPLPQARPGGRLPLHCTGLGKAILAFSPPALLTRVIDGGLRPMSAHSITDPVRLEREIRLIRRERLAFDTEETGAGVYCVASPLIDGEHTVVGALSLSGMSTAASAREVAPAVLASALSLSQVLVAQTKSGNGEYHLA